MAQDPSHSISNEPATEDYGTYDLCILLLSILSLIVLAVTVLGDSKGQTIAYFLDIL